MVVARWLETEARVLFFDEPTRGIDVGAKAELFKLMGQLVADGKAIVLISSYLPELNEHVRPDRRDFATAAPWGR